MEWFWFILAFYIQISIITSLIILMNGTDGVMVLPKEIYEGTKFNIFTCWILSILLFIIVPLVFIIKFICWGAHAGRRN